MLPFLLIRTRAGLPENILQKYVNPSHPVHLRNLY